MVEKIVSALVPPSDEKGVQRWRWFMAGTVAGVLLWIAWAMGTFAMFGSPGLASAGELAKLESRLVNIQTKQDVGLRLALAEEICRLFKLRNDNGADPQLWRALNDTFNDRQEDYRAVNGGQTYNISECSAPR